MRVHDFARISPYAGIAAAIIFTVLYVLAATNYTNYSMASNYLSDLGAGEKSGLLFNSGVIIAGVLGVIFAFGVYKTLRNLGKKGGIVFIISSLSLIGVGIFPEQSPLIHVIFSGAFFIFSAISLILIGTELRNKTKSLGYFSILAGVIALVFIPTGLPIIEHTAVFALILWVFIVSVYVMKKAL